MYRCPKLTTGYLMTVGSYNGLGKSASICCNMLCISWQSHKECLATCSHLQLVVGWKRNRRVTDIGLESLASLIQNREKCCQKEDAKWVVRKSWLLFFKKIPFDF